MIKNSLFLLIAALLSAGLMVSISVISILMGGFTLRSRQSQNRTIVVEKKELTETSLEQRPAREQPRRKPQTIQSVRSGPRFSMDLGIQGGVGASVPLSLANRAGDGGEENSDGTVDTRPEMTSPLDFTVPAGVRDAERNATLRLLFCVDVAGKAYNIRVTEENPSGLGLAQAGTEALKKILFRPALREGQPVPFCGMEQPIEIKFRN